MKPKALRAAKPCQGFTLVELIIVITLTGVVGVLASTIVGRQMEGYIDTTRRAEMIARANMAMQLIARDLRYAVPFSVRINGSAIEWVPIEGFGRYRKLPTAGAGDILDFSTTDNAFDVFGPMPGVLSSHRVVVGNSAIAASGFNLYQSASDGSVLPAGSHVITDAAVTPSINGSAIELSPAFQFSQDSVASRFYLVDGPSSYVCSGGEINRFESYALQSTQPTNPSAAPLSSASSALLLDSVSSCSFGYTATDEQHGLVTLQVELTESGETVSLVRFVHVENRP